MLLTIALIACDEERHIGLALASVNALRAAQPTEVLVLLDQRVLRLGQDDDERSSSRSRRVGDHRQAAT
ncbi:MAG: hypothetical protein HC876_14965, partial [Chloroflexaceae bacterium]|nr:hypothetical protein [Chloroflexaceae bacterium]